MLKVVSGIETAAGHKSIGGTYGSGIAERNPYVIIIILLKERIFKDAEDVTSVVVPVFGHELGSNLFQLVGKTFFTGHTEAVLQRCSNSIVVLVFVFPKIKAAGIFPAACVGNVKNIFEPWIIAAGVNQRNTLRTTTDISAHLLIPKVVIGTGSSIRLLSKNHQLLMERVLIQPSHCFKERCPFPKTACNLLCGVVCHLCVKIQFTRHPHPPHHQNRDTAPSLQSPRRT